MTAVAIEIAQKELDSLIRRARAGEEIVIVNGAEAIAKLVAINSSKAPRVPGALKGQLGLPDSFFFDPLPADELAGWWGEGQPPK